LISPQNQWIQGESLKMKYGQILAIATLVHGRISQHLFIEQGETKAMPRSGSAKFKLEMSLGALVPLAALFAITSGRFGLARGSVATGLFVVSLLAHEFGHMVVGLLIGARVRAFGFCLFGTYIRRNKEEGLAEILISAAGPLINLLIVMLLWNQTGVLNWLAQMNFVLLVLNLLPAFNSDGQRLLQEVKRLSRSHTAQPSMG
jgi:Zn-dependent protease